MKQTTAPLAHEATELKIALNISFRRLTESVGKASIPHFASGGIRLRLPSEDRYYTRRTLLTKSAPLIPHELRASTPQNAVAGVPGIEVQSIRRRCPVKVAFLAEFAGEFWLRGGLRVLDNKQSVSGFERLEPGTFS